MNQITVHPKTKRRALDLLARAADLELPKDVLESIREAHHRLQLPLADVLSKVPGDSVVERARTLGIARQTYYQWLRGAARPNPEQAEKLAKLTGIPEHRIRGRADVNETDAKA